jgi:serine protease AprX
MKSGFVLGALALYLTGLAHVDAADVAEPAVPTHAIVEFNGVEYTVEKSVRDGAKLLLYCDGERVYTPAELRAHVAALEPMILTRTVAQAVARARATDQLNLIVVLRPQPAGPISRQLRAAAEAQLEELSCQIRAISRRALPTRSLTPAEERAFVPQRLSDEDFQSRRALAEQRDELERQLRVETARQIAAAVSSTQAELTAFVEALGGHITVATSVLNTLVASLPVDRIGELARHPLVAQIDLDQPGQPELDIQRQSQGLDTGFWAAGIDGGVYDVGVLDTGVQQNHPALATHTFLSNCGDQDFDGHGTGVAGILASTDATYRGVAYGCDTIVVALAGDASTSMSGMDYIAGTGEPENVNYSFGNGSANDADYNVFDQFFDAAVGNFGFMVSKSAGNGGYASVPTLTHPAPAYNLLVSADMDDANTVPRDDDEIATTSSVGPTLGGRKKPDLTAPGNNTMTTSVSGAFADLGGTSASSPHTGGGIVLLCDQGTTNVMAGKAVLLNTTDAIDDNGTATPRDDFWVPGSLWNRRYGWGYLNLGAAYLHGLDVFVDAVPDHPDQADFRLYLGQMYTNERATLVWQRHVAYNGVTYPTQVETLSDLDLSAYRAADGQVLASSTSHLDNVEQIAVSEDAVVVLKVAAFSAFDPNVPTETFALATQENFVSAGGPAFSVSFTHPACVGASQSFAVLALVTNTGDLAAYDVFVTLEGLTIIAGDNPAALGTVLAGQQAAAAWTAEAPAIQGIYSLAATIASPSYGETFAGFGSSSYRVASCGPGDLNCDGAVNFDDINPFVLALADPDGYATAFPLCPILNGDCNPNGKVDFDDINCFIALLSGGD